MGRVIPIQRRPGVLPTGADLLPEGLDPKLDHLTPSERRALRNTERWGRRRRVGGFFRVMAYLLRGRWIEKVDRRLGHWIDSRPDWLQAVIWLTVGLVVVMGAIEYVRLAVALGDMLGVGGL